MLNQAAVTTPSFSPALSVVPVVRSASESRALVAFQSVLIKGSNERYLSHPLFHQAFEDGYDYPGDSGDFEDEEVTLDKVLEFLEEHLSFGILQRENDQLAHFHLEPMVYAQRVGFILGCLRWMFDADRAPWLPLSLLQKWYSIEYLTRSVAARFIAHEQPQQPVKQSISLGTYWE